MAPRRAAAAARAKSAAATAAPVVEDEPQEQQEQEEEEELVTLQFDEPLTWKAGRPIPTGELHRRLETLSRELQEMEQGADTVSLTKVAKDLVSHNLLGHKDKGVKAYVACCLVDILKICAPHAPLTGAQLKDMFDLIVNSILPNLQDQSNAYDAQHVYVLASLAESKSITLLSELDNNEGLLLRLFSTFFDAVSGPNSASISQNIQIHMLDVLVCLVDEGAPLPPKVVDVIMAQFLRAATPGSSGAKDRAEVDENQSTLLLKTEPEAYLMAQQLCNSCADKMARYVAQYFADVIMDVSHLGGGGRHNGHRGVSADFDDGEHALAPSESELRELRKAHLLLRELWRACPDVLANVIPQVDAELEADNAHLRQLATETIGDMISGIGAAGPPHLRSVDPSSYPQPKLADMPNPLSSASVLSTPLSPQSFAQTHPNTYQNFISRKKDRSSAIRAAWVTAVGYVLATSAGGVGLGRDEQSVLVLGLGEKLADNDEKVRLAAVKAIECFSLSDVLTKLAVNGGVMKEGSVLSALADRCRDRKAHVRVEAMSLLAKLWALSTGELDSNPGAVAPLNGITSRIFNAVYLSDREVDQLIDQVLFEFLVPLTFPDMSKKWAKNANGSSAQIDADATRAHRIMVLVASMETNAKLAFFAVMNRQPMLANVVDNLLKQCEALNGGVAGKDGKKASGAVAQTIDYLAKLFPDEAKAKADLSKFAKTNDRRSYQMVKFMISRETDYKTMLKAFKELSKRWSGNNAHVLGTLQPLLFRCGQILYNKSHLSTFLEYSKSDQGGLAAVAHEILNSISQKNPKLLKTQIGSLCEELQKQAPTEDKPNELMVVETLKACSSFAAKYPEEIPSDDEFSRAMESYALYGQPPKAAKYAVNIILARKDERSLGVATNLLNRVMDGLDYGTPHFLNKLTVISQLERLAPQATADFEEPILELAVQKILRVARAEAPEEEDQEEGEATKWVDDADLEEEGQAKLLALKIMVNRMLALKGEEVKSQTSETTMKMLRVLVVRDGELTKTKKSPWHFRRRLRLLAAQSMLKLCIQRDEVLNHADFNKLALVAMDPTPHVRAGFIQKLQKYLTLVKLKPRFYTIVFLAAFEPDEALKLSIETWIRARARHFQETKTQVMELTMARLLSLLAHHPDYEGDLRSLVDHARCLLFYASNVANESNLGMIYRYAERTKQTRDAIDPAKSEALYAHCDLALAVLRKWQEKRGWIFEAYPQRIGLPAGLFASLPSHDAAQQIAETNYLPDGIDEALDDLIKVIDRKRKRKFDDRAEPQHQAKKVKAPAKPSSSSHPPKATASSSSSKPSGGGGAAKKASSSSSSKHKPSSSKTKRERAPRPSSSSPINDADRRRSGRSRQSKSYVERDSSEDDNEMLEDGVAEWDYFSGSDAEEAAAARVAGAAATGSRSSRAKGKGAGVSSKPTRRTDDDGDDSSSLSEPDAMDEDDDDDNNEGGGDKMEVEEEEAPDDSDKADAEDDDDDNDDDDDEDYKGSHKKAAAAGGSRTNGRRAAAAAAASAAKSKAKPAASPSARLASRAKPRAAARKARDAYDVEEDDEDDD